MSSLILYTTAGCHLCELAEEILFTLSQQYDITFTCVEIGDNDDLIQRYGTRIPVIAFEDHTELNWPFEAQDILRKTK